MNEIPYGLNLGLLPRLGKPRRTCLSARSVACSINRCHRGLLSSVDRSVARRPRGELNSYLRNASVSLSEGSFLVKWGTANQGITLVVPQRRCSGGLWAAYAQDDAAPCIQCACVVLCPFPAGGGKCSFPAIYRNLEQATWRGDPSSTRHLCRSSDGWCDAPTRGVYLEGSGMVRNGPFLAGFTSANALSTWNPCTQCACVVLSPFPTGGGQSSFPAIHRKLEQAAWSGDPSSTRYSSCPFPAGGGK